MARKKSRKKKTSALGGARQLVTAIDWSRMRPYAIVTAWVLALGAAVAALITGVPRLEASVAAAAWESEVTITFEDKPVWVRGDLLTLLTETARRQLTGDPLRREELVRVHDALAGTGWFDRIDQVRRTTPSLVEIRAAFVRPAAVVRDDEMDHLVDFDGHLLPRSYPHGEALHQIVVRGARYQRPQRPGVAWDGADVHAALSLLRAIDGRPWQKQVVAVDLTSYLGDGTLVIETDIGARVVWGSAPGQEKALEVISETKLAYLDRAFSEFSRIDTGHRGELHFYERGYFAE